jgi:hypothetical protein
MRIGNCGSLRPGDGCNSRAHDKYGRRRSPPAGHIKGSFPFSETLSGFSDIDTVDVLYNFGAKHDGSSYDSGRLSEAFVADNGCGVTITYDAGHEYNAPPFNNTDGTTTIVYTYSGKNAKTKAIDGLVLEQGSGSVQVRVIYAADSDAISVSVVSLSGQNPNLSVQPKCSVTAPDLTGA